ncbi:cytochrome c oxidase subunit 5b [Cryptococcus neoformans Bt1]|nr:cytochrome c oxidase subunit 5b [Cryptococcus neoformans var. grubii Bt1]OWZ51545.1 cytochrome c oxidase subunit 5b [Cryptococcus neoformans var. grubii c45]OXB38020.1 cytochrome c oxidase subunit 5b [Cryptococcus neoformans var. grubii]OXC62336.1 cytochrome c oxidase subunit 5b [Cryptococcus neoformans var. grubii MW-RSA852]
MMNDWNGRKWKGKFELDRPWAEYNWRSECRLRSEGYGVERIRENQSTGLERFELLGNLEGVDVFDMKPLEVTRLGTVEDPIPIYSLFPERQIGCTGFPVDSHDTIWLNVNHTLKNHRCPECGSVYTLNFQGDEALLHGGGHHH